MYSTSLNLILSFPAKYITIFCIMGTCLIPSTGFGGQKLSANLGNKEQTLEDKAEWLKHLISSIPFQRIKKGKFVMGSPFSERGRDSDENQRSVEITRPFEIMEKEVTQYQWMLVMGKNPAEFKSKDDCDDYENDMCPNNPVESVSYDDVQNFIKRINDFLELTNCDGTPDSQMGCYRLPTEAEWEYSVRADTTLAYSFGDDPSELKDFAWYLDNAKGRTHKVGMKKANPWGLYDVHGNVWEWVQDSYAKKLPGGKDPLNNFDRYRLIHGGDLKISAQYLHSVFYNITPVRLSESTESIPKDLRNKKVDLFRVIRGGSLDVSWRGLRSAYRGIVYPDLKFNDIGFRLVKTL